MLGDKLMLYQIVKWGDTFENDRSRCIDNCFWIKMPVKQDGLGYLRILSQKNGPAIYGAFCAIAGRAIRLCEKAKDRDGWLTEDGLQNGTPLTPDSLSLVTKMPAATIKEMLELLSSQPIGWIRVWEQDGSEVTPDSRPPTALEKEETEEKEEESSALPPQLSQEADMLCRVMQGEIEKRVPRVAQKNKGKIVEYNSKSGWGKDARLLLEVDGISHEEALSVLNWSQGHHFWNTNILCMETFRKQYDKLRLQMLSEKGAGDTPEPLKAQRDDLSDLDDWDTSEEG